MSFLAWAFSLGGLAIAFPILFHLIRPTPRGSQSFSSLMFLRESPPRISRRSRIDNWLLLLMRAGIILLLAVAFMRPFIRSGGQVFVSDLPGQRVAILIDQSASMRRDGIWQTVGSELDEVLDQLQPGDDVGLFSFDEKVRTLVGFSDEPVVDLASRLTLVRNQFSGLQPEWRRTDIGNALVSAADMVSEVDDDRRAEIGMQIVLISDMQQGAELAALQTVVWPKDVRVDVRTVKARIAGNASARLLPEENVTALDSGRRVRLSNAEDSGTENLSIAWADADGKIDEESRTGFYVSPGTSLVTRMPVSKTIQADHLVLRGDRSEFDNRFFVTSRSQQTVAIACFGNERDDDPASNLYFLSRVIPESRSQIVKVEQYSPDAPVAWNDDRTPRLVVVTAEVSDAVADQLASFVQAGGVLLAVVSDSGILDGLPLVLPGVSKNPDVAVRPGEYAMLASIDFSHPLFAPLSGPRFNDFTGIHFWNHLPLTIEESDSTRVIARFDDDTPAMWQHDLGAGKVIGFASSWRPDDSQLALSSKFVPLITSVLGLANRNELLPESGFVGQPISLPESDQPWSINGPDGPSTVQGGEPGTVRRFETPGVYELTNGDQQVRVAINLDPSESRTQSMDVVSLESFDVKTGTQPTREELAGSLQKMKDTQLESRQRIWKWLLVAAICLLIVESLFAGRRQSNSVLNKVVTA